MVLKILEVSGMLRILCEPISKVAESCYVTGFLEAASRQVSYSPNPAMANDSVCLRVHFQIGSENNNSMQFASLWVLTRGT